MFDWDEEELSNMIWGDDGETDDHIVPFKGSEQLNKKEHNDESKTIKLAEEKIAGASIDSKLGSSSGHNDGDEVIPQSDFCMTSWLDSSSLSDGREADPGSCAAELSKCLAEPDRYNQTREKTSELGKGLDIFHSTDESKEHGDFDEYGWANIGSFDDLDRLFSNDVPVFGEGSLSGADELWPSSKDLSNSPSKSLPSFLDAQDTEFEQQQNQQFSLHEAPKVENFLEHKGQTSVDNQPYQQSKMMKFSKTSGTSEAEAFQLYGQRNSPGKFVTQLAPSRSSLTAVHLQSESQASGILSHYPPHMPSQYMATSGVTNLTNPYLLSTVQCPDVKNQLIHPSYNPTTTAISLNMATNASSLRPSTMTPQEKLEKLRRRQQMQAMLAIQRQEQQFRHQVPVADQSITQSCRQDIPLQGLAAMPPFDPNSSDSGVDNSAQFSTLFRLQDVVAKLDMGTRTCIRDSLFRLAGSAGQRLHNNDTAHSNKTDQEAIPSEESRYRYGEIPDKETVTNPTDRIVAHLLFHRPFDILMAKHVEGPESPASSKMGTEEKGKFPNRRTQENQMINKQKAKEEEAPEGSQSHALPNSGSNSNVGESFVEASQGDQRKL